ncbi:hypothetical protein BOTBODRAFT_130432 [Botryobasidium botryosum FD-172 SS1]|uniref:Uncharacterized protein n=1 Tax=Botryobasidium botryosum (strain FD-172 SS1) TaxID=930990 RepID=A0A067MX73_BOTB1|nr:hypothetical protein BOTBODRAFT_130432 [Botryobasidium botryosum FD-172 SS1]
MIVVNDWCFCKAHGSEYCARCTCDYRLVNNARFEDELDEEARWSFNLDERVPQNAYVAGAIAVAPNSESYKCQRHGSIDCHACFDWVGQVHKEIDEAASTEKWLQKRARWADRVGPNN